MCVQAPAFRPVLQNERANVPQAAQFASYPARTEFKCMFPGIYET